MAGTYSFAALTFTACIAGMHLEPRSPGRVAGIKMWLIMPPQCNTKEVPTGDKLATMRKSLDAGHLSFRPRRKGVAETSNSYNVKTMQRLDNNQEDKNTHFHTLVPSQSMKNNEHCLFDCNTI